MENQSHQITPKEYLKYLRGGLHKMAKQDAKEEKRQGYYINQEEYLHKHDLHCMTCSCELPDKEIIKTNSKLLELFEAFTASDEAAQELMLMVLSKFNVSRKRKF